MTVGQLLELANIPADPDRFVAAQASDTDSGVTALEEDRKLEDGALLFVGSSPMVTRLASEAAGDPGEIGAASETNPPPENVERRVLRCFAAGHTSVASKTIAFAALGIPFEGQGSINFPCDVEDLADCLRLLKDVPELEPHWREVLHQHGSATWRTLIDRWDDLTTLMIEELGPDFPEPPIEAPRSTRLLLSLLDAPQRTEIETWRQKWLPSRTTPTSLQTSA